jgi:hypothetical protein
MKSDYLPPEPGRNQFALTARATDIPGWCQLRLGERLYLSHHPHLNVHRATRGTRSLTLLGLIVDWRDPLCGPGQVVERLLESATNLADCLRGTEELCGRWVLIYQDGDKQVLFHDVSASRQVCFAGGAQGAEFCCASEPGLLARLAGLATDPEAMAFYREYSGRNAEYWYPGDRLPVEHARVLLPGHTLDLSSAQVRRYWPHSQRAVFSDAEVSERVAIRLAGFLRAASEHYDLALGLSAGWDSRVVLAGCRDIRDRVAVYSAQRHDMSRQHPDVALPEALAVRLGLDHHRVTQGAAASPQILSLLRQHTLQPHTFFAPAMEAEHRYFQYRRVAILGNVSEVAKRPGGGWLASMNERVEQLSSRGQTISSDELAEFVGMGRSPFVLQAFDEWLADIGDGCGYKISDLFYLEQGCGRRLASAFTEFEFAWRDIFLPFNCRALLTDLLSAPEEGRCGPRYELYRMIIRRLWPETLGEPVNPPPPPASLARRIGKRVVRHLSGKRKVF